MIYNLSEIEHIAKTIISSSKSNILLFYGEMGAGKTTLVKSLAKQLGVQETASSPTFSIVNEYISDNNELLYHFDFYRLEKEEEALDLGFEEYLTQGDWIFIEWPEKITSFLPLKAQKITISTIGASKRQLTLH
ncbi:tRNA (adenosine(37)-N6)-threonylcarbamoyltransferase complex ATPase subunit type 1 TsaE [Dokdonia sp. Dokd-P16]|uniref:tRNA (adenosine(37)-N6)-threonylcarbamoyltransferase complex ATPase subunit type 1 TsaE n=1 Tax=Dokdonia sp. Dokd-P16 TaxID=2173169 RepID=UPI0029372F87|nr:tRNA (adenosine(37)-N6)-threonylcarbamoyltransferase complex ATPase subunit type 1 TsaE [Dokdonia sp. Dokd-P16]